MGDLNLSGTLDLAGVLSLAGQGGKVTVNGAEVLVETMPTDAAQGTAPPVIIPPPPGPPQNPDPNVNVICSFNKTVTAGGKNVVTQGIAVQGNPRQWPGMVQPSTVNSGVKVNQIAMNVVGDSGIIFPSGGTASFNASGQS